MTLKNNTALATTPILYYNLKSCQYVGAQQSLNHLIDHYLNHHDDYRSNSFLTSSQQDLFNLIAFVISQYDFRTTNSTPNEKVINRIQILIKKDAFNHLISSLTSQHFSKLISEERGYQLFFKLMFFSYLMTQLKTIRQLNKDAQQCLNTCNHFLKVIQNQPTFYHTFIDNFYQSSQMSLNDKLFSDSTVGVEPTKLSSFNLIGKTNFYFLMKQLIVQNYLSYCLDF